MKIAITGGTGFVGRHLADKLVNLAGLHLVRRREARCPVKLPVIRGTIARRILVNFRVAPQAVQKLLPAPFRPKLVNGWAMAGICLIRLEQVRPDFVPGALGLASENAAHRIAVEWDDGGNHRAGVFIPRRDTDSLLNRLAGGTLFPGVHHAAEFRVWESDNRFKVQMQSRDGRAFVRLAAQSANEWPVRSIFNSLAEASAFFQAGAVGWSPAQASGQFEGLELRTGEWRVEPLRVERVESSFFENQTLFPRGSVEFDNALLMRGIEHQWRALGTMSAPLLEASVERPQTLTGATLRRRPHHGASAFFEMP